MVCDGLVGQVLNTHEAVRGVEDEQTQEDGEGDGVSHELHEGASQDLTNLKGGGGEVRQATQQTSNFCFLFPTHLDK